jgi:DNA-binding winged helix-turn-helix (wHTH) protein
MAAGIHRFAEFELDRDCRCLRLRGREIALQPRVLDLLLYLVEHRERVVSKEELLDALWPGMVVTESSLQRAVSLARAALQQGGLGEAIRNYARHGYRFLDTAGQTDSPEAYTDTMSGAQAQAEAERCYASSRWKAAMEAYAAADRLSPLGAESLERWGTAAQCAGDLAAAALPLERAAVVYSSRGEHAAAARATISLARVQIESLDVAVTQGCLRRAARLLSGLPRGVEHGFLAWMDARLHLYQGDLPQAIRSAIEARDIGRELQDADIESMGLLMCGIALQATGDTSGGMALQDEAAAMVLAGNVSALMGGIVYCGFIASCCNGGDWLRAEQWGESFGRWCRRSNIDTFTGGCLIHRAEVFFMSGKLDLAGDAIQRADPIIRVGARWALGDAYRLMGDVHLARGEDDAAERSYTHAYQHGWDPYPGYAILLHRRGRGDEAVRGLQRAAALTNWVAGERRSRHLAYAAQIASLLGRLDEARALLESLDSMRGAWDSGAVAGQVERARGELSWATGNQDEAVREFACAVDILRRRHAVMDAALCRMRLADVLALTGDHATAAMELAAAETVFEAAGARGYLVQCQALRERAIRSPGR